MKIFCSQLKKLTEIDKTYFMEGRIIDCIRYRYICICFYQKKRRKSLQWDSGEFLQKLWLFYLFPEFLWFFMMQSRVTDVAGFEIRDHKKYTRKMKKMKRKILMPGKNKQINNDWLANVHLLPTWFLMKHFPVLNYKLSRFQL